jgi:hypothetical protein
MATEHHNVRLSARRGRRISGVVALPAVAAGLVGVLVASSSPASAALAPSDPYRVCLPTPCMPIANAVVTGTMNWTANANDFEASNARLPVVTVFFTEIDLSGVLRRQAFRIERGEELRGRTAVRPSTYALRVTLCPSASDAPQANCADTVVQR